MFTDQGSKNPNKTHRIIWSVFTLLATMAIVLLGNVKADINVLEAV